MNLEAHLTKLVTNILTEYYSVEIDQKLIQFHETKKDFEGDITFVVFPLARIAKKSPEQTGEEIGALLKSKIDIISAYNTVKGFLNLVINDSYWLNELNTISSNSDFGIDKSKNSTYMVEFSSPNTNKPLHLGHLRNIFLGYSVSRILEAAGNKVIKTQIINDRGIHICKSMLAWQRFGNNETPDSTGMKGDKLVGKYYVVFDKELKKETAILLENWEKGNFDVKDSVKEEYQRLAKIHSEKENDKAQKSIASKINKLANNHTPIMFDVKEMLLKWEAQEKDVYQLWEKMNGWVYKGFDATYNAMQVSFDELYYESETYLTGKEMVEEGLNKGVFYKKEDGSVWIDLSDDGLDEKIVLRSDGTAVYITQDIGTAQQRMLANPDIKGMVYTVGNEQDYHFEVLFLILKKLGYTWAENCYHLSYGMVDLKNSDGVIGKMKSREGTVVDADDLVAEVVDTATKKTKERGHIEGMSEQEKKELFRMIGLGGLKYFLLKVDPRKRMTFNPEESVDLNGHTGPFIQYVYARISSLLRKAGDFKSSKSDLNTNIEPIEREIIKKMVSYPTIVSEASKEYSPALIANYAFDLCKLYNTFWHQCQILKEDDQAIKQMRLQLSENLAKIIKSAMYLLGIDVPIRM